MPSVLGIRVRFCTVTGNSMDQEELRVINRTCHDIRSRLNLLSLCAQILPTEDNLTPRQKDMMARMLRGVDQIELIIESTLNELDHIAKRIKNDDI